MESYSLVLQGQLNCSVVYNKFRVLKKEGVKVNANWIDKKMHFWGCWEGYPDQNLWTFDNLNNGS